MTLTGKKLTVPSDRLRKALQQKLTGTLGGKQAVVPIRQAPDQNAMFHQSLNQSLKLADDAMNAMSARPADRANKYQQGVMHAMRSHTKNLSEPGHKRFTAIQKAALQGYCNVRSWNEVPQIWKDIEDCKSDGDLRRVLIQYWSRYQQAGQGVLFYNIYWSEELIAAIRTLNLCSCITPTYATAMDGISILHMLPWSREDKINHERDHAIRNKTARTRTYAEEKKFLKSARLPPTMYERTMMLLTTHG